MSILSKIFRNLPSFKGKLRIASFLLKRELNKKYPVEFVGKNKIHFTIPNTIDAIGKELFINGIFEIKTINVIKGLLKENSSFFDVGANIGAICLPLAKTSKAKIHVFEPSKEVFKYLQLNVQNNKVMNIILNNYAVHSRDGIDVDFYPVEDKYGHSSLAPTYKDQLHYPVKTVSLDAYCQRNNISKIDVLKIDVQGFEIEVLHGCRYLIKNRAIDNIIFEFEDWAEGNTEFKAGGSQEFLLSNGFEIFDLNNKKLESKITSGSQMLWAKLKDS